MWEKKPNLTSNKGKSKLNTHVIPFFLSRCLTFLKGEKGQRCSGYRKTVLSNITGKNLDYNKILENILTLLILKIT